MDPPQVNPKVPGDGVPASKPIDVVSTASAGVHRSFCSGCCEEAIAGWKAESATVNDSYLHLHLTSSRSPPSQLKLHDAEPPQCGATNSVKSSAASRSMHMPLVAEAAMLVFAPIESILRGGREHRPRGRYLTLMPLGADTPFDAIFPLFQYDGMRCGLTARTADRAVPVEFRRCLAVNRIT